MFYRRLLPILQPKTRAWSVPAQALLGLAMLLAVPLAGAADTAPAPPAREAAPPMLSQIVDETGAAYTMAEMQGGPVLVNFWATWCAPCIAELPALSRAATALADDGVTVLLVSIDRGGAARAPRETGVRGLPTTLLLDSAQGSAWRFIGPFEWDDPAMLGVIRRLLAD